MWRAIYVTGFAIGVVLASKVGAQTGDAAPDGQTAPKASPVKQQPASSEQIAKWVRDLDADNFEVRQTATAALSAAGKKAVAPLAKAAAGDSLEVSARSVSILERLAGDDDSAVADAARDALESAARDAKTTVSERAADALSRIYAKHAESVRKRLYGLGVVQGSGENFLRKDIQRDDQLVVTKKRWTGTSDDLRLLAYLEDIKYLSIHGVRLDETALSHLTRLRHVRHLELYGTGLDAKGAAKLREALPGLSVDVRSGGVLGVSRFGTERCELREIIEGTPAAKAGLQPMDIVSHIDGKPLATYRELISYLATRSGGDKVKLAIERGGKKIEVEVTLASWGDQ
jgi:hypothetical protein